MEDKHVGFIYAEAREDGVRMKSPDGSAVLFTVDSGALVTPLEAVEAGLTIVSDLGERIPDVKRLRRRKVKWEHKDGFIKYTDRGESEKAFLKRVRLTGEDTESYSTNILREELERLGIKFDVDEFGEIWIDP
jgi:hypothetical protein